MNLDSYYVLTILANIIETYTASLLVKAPFHSAGSMLFISKGINGMKNAPTWLENSGLTLSKLAAQTQVFLYVE